jgi:hypothetical protein
VRFPGPAHVRETLSSARQPELLWLVETAPHSAAMNPGGAVGTSGTGLVGGGGAAAAAAATGEAGSVRLQFAAGQQLGGCLAWDRASGLLAIELQPNSTGGDGSGSIPVAIVDPQSPEVRLRLLRCQSA